MAADQKIERAVLVTGANRGIGRGIAEAFGASDTCVYVNYRNHADEAEDVVRTIESKGGTSVSLQGDVSSPDDVSAMFEVINERSNRLDVLVNNAAIFPMAGFGSIDPKVWDDVMSVNLRGPFLCAQTFAPLLSDTGSGRIINITSTVPYSAPIGLLPYVTSKAGLYGFTRALARELGEDGITVNAVATGKVVTEGLKVLSAEGLFELADAKEKRSSQCIPRFGEPRDLASVCLFLASPEANFLTGQIITVDGGRTFF